MSREKTWCEKFEEERERLYFNKTNCNSVSQYFSGGISGMVINAGLFRDCSDNNLSLDSLKSKCEYEKERQKEQQYRGING
jgi:hypothetical protein